MVVIDRVMMDELVAAARANPRRRMHRNFHASYDEACQRLMIAMEPDSYIRPHRHLADPKPEAFIALKGRLALFTFEDDGAIASVTLLGPNEGAMAVDLPEGLWHAVVSLQTGSLFYETKPGPFNPIMAKDMAPWAPDASDKEAAAAYLESLRAAAEG